MHLVRLIWLLTLLNLVVVGLIFLFHTRSHLIDEEFAASVQQSRHEWKPMPGEEIVQRTFIPEVATDYQREIRALALWALIMVGIAGSFTLIQIIR